jgi:hypothetical protein
MLQQLKKIVLTQRSLFNSKSLADRIPKILLDVLSGTRKGKMAMAMADTGSSRMGRGSGENMTLVTSKIKSAASSKRIGHTETDSLEVTSRRNRFKMDKLFLVRVNPDLLKLMRRIQRFAQVSSAHT